MEWTDGIERAGTMIGRFASGRHTAARKGRRAGRWRVAWANYFAWLAIVTLGLVGPMACGGSTKGEVASPDEPLDSWQGPLAALFDDSINPAAVGMSLEGARAQDDPMIRSRCATADLVARLRVNTVTRDSVGAKVTYHLTLQVGQPPLLPSKLADRSVELVIHQSSPAFGLVSSLESTLRGKTFIGFVRRFIGPHGPELHWVLTADTPEVAAMVSTATMGEAPDK
jgi:hypothetical protein